MTEFLDPPLSIDITFTVRNLFNVKSLIKLVQEDGNKIEPVHEISNNVVCASSKVSDQPAQTRSLTRAFASRLSIL